MKNNYHCEWGLAAFDVITADGQEHCVLVHGRDRWALECLLAAGELGCTPIDHPGPRWSAYVFKLRRLGIEIETVHESHDGPFRGRHARYILKSQVTPADREERGAA